MLRRAARAIPRPIWALAYPLIARFVAPKAYYEGVEYGERGDAFARIYEENRWRDSESKSGVGSTLAYTAHLRERIASLLATRKVRVLLDAPCGDYNWMRHVRLPEGCRYLGRDIVPTLVEALRAAFPNGDWGVLDIVTGPIPDADIWLCRDVLFHLPLADGMAVLRNMKASNVAFFLAKNYDFVQENRDVRPGGFRYVNLRKAPFNLPAPVQRVADFNVPGPPAYLDLWSREQIARAMTG